MKIEIPDTYMYDVEHAIRAIYKAGGQTRLLLYPGEVSVDPRMKDYLDAKVIAVRIDTTPHHPRDPKVNNPRMMP